MGVFGFCGGFGKAIQKQPRGSMIGFTLCLYTKIGEVALPVLYFIRTQLSFAFNSATSAASSLMALTKTGMRAA